MLGTYGNVRLSDASVSDMEVVVMRPAAGGEDQRPPTVYAGPEVLSHVRDGGGEEVEGLYRLTVSPSAFPEDGLYKVVIRPRHVDAVLTDCAVLAGSETRGVVLDASSRSLKGLGDLTGYRVEYYDTTNGRKIRNLFRIVTSAVRVEPVVSPSGGGRTLGYRPYASGTLLFLTLTPSINPLEGQGLAPFYGMAGQKVRLSNTFFTPVVLDVEVGGVDVSDVYEAVTATQVLDRDRGRMVTYAEDGSVIGSYTVATVKRTASSQGLDVRLRDDSPSQAGLPTLEEVKKEVTNA